MNRRVAHTVPYSWPYDGCLRAERLAFVVAGADEHWFTACASASAVMASILQVAQKLTDAGVVVIAASQNGSERHRVHVPGASQVLTEGIDAFFASNLDLRLRALGRDQLLLGGFGLEGPVHSTLRSANDRGYECLTLRDVCAPLDADLDDASYSQIAMSGGIFGAIGTMGDVIAALFPDNERNPR